MSDPSLHSPSENRASANPSALLQGVALVCLFWLPVLSALEHQGDTDLWWHLASGRWIVAHQAVPQTDPFTSFGHNQRWWAYSWLFEVGIYGLHQLGGLAGVVVYSVLLNVGITALLFYVLWGRLGNFLFSAGLTAWATLGMASIQTPRPWLLTIFFFLCELAILEHVRRRGKPWALLWLLPLFTLWANVHIQFILGLAVLLLYAAEPMLAVGAQKLGLAVETCQTPRWWIWIALAGAALATLINPYFTGVYSVVGELVGQHAVPFAYIMELKAPTFRSLPDWAALGLVLAAVFVLGRKKALPLAPALLLLAGMFLFFHAIRDVWFAVIAAALMLAEPSSSATSATSPAPRWGRLSLAVALSVGIIALLTGRWRFLSNAVLEEGIAKSFPVAAADYVEGRHMPGKIFNHFNWGGYLIWRFPDGRVTMDGRTNLHGDARLVRIAETWSGSPQWAEDPELKTADVIIAQNDMALTALLKLSFQYKLLKETPNATVFVPVGK